tara:strand:- start:337 stop:642 length:306 start_codon:yes stop_codon:yes gene_type:complete
MSNNQDSLKKQMLIKEREYLPGTTVAQVKVEVSLHRAYIDLKSNNKMFEVVDVHSERFDARIKSDDAYEARDIMKENIVESCKNWDALPSDKQEDKQEKGK